MIVAFHAALALLTVLLLRRARRRPADAWKALLAWSLVAMGVVVVSTLLVYGGPDTFGAMRLGAWLAFCHAPLALALFAAFVPTARSLRATSALAAVLAIAIGIDAFLVEPHDLVVTRHVVRSPKVARRLRILVLSDVQTDEVGDYERSVVARARALAPDVVLLPGDYVQSAGASYLERARTLGALLASIRSPLGTFAVEGNVEDRTWVDDVFGGTDVRASAARRTTTFDGISITALSFDDSFDVGAHVPDAPGFHVVFGHAPDFSLGDVHADLLVAGHTHGGQVQLPFVGPLVTFSRVSRAHAAGGLFALARGRSLVVSRGIGMERGHAPRLRFRCRPELVVIDVVPVR